MHIAMLAGEASGDQLGAELIKSLRRINPCIQFDGVGGPLMQAQGFHSLFPIEEFSVMGLTEVLKSLPKLLYYRKKLTSHYESTLPDAFVGIDYPEFNLSLERRLKDLGIYTAHYVSPSVWAWREERIHHIKRSCNLMLTLFDFETKFYQTHQMNAVCCGHPLVDMIPKHSSQTQALAMLGLTDKTTPETKYLAVLPGSRVSEVEKMLPIFTQVMALLAEALPNIQFLIPAATDTLKTRLAQRLAQHSQLNTHVFLGQGRMVMQAADAVLLSSGTATLEAMLLEKPMLVSYKVSRLTAKLAKKRLTIPHFSLPNLLAGEGIVPEFMQDDIDPEKMAETLKQLLVSGSARDSMVAQLSDLRHCIRKDAADNAAKALYQDILYHEMIVD